MQQPSPDLSSTLYIGLLSGTSADGVDGALVDFSGHQPHLVTTHISAIPNQYRDHVFTLAEGGLHEIDTMRKLDTVFAQLFSETALKLCEKAGLSPRSIAAIGSHGQTIRHYPPNDKNLGYSLQIGDPNIIVERTGITTVADFRRRDIAAKGHGAPLAPGLHHALFQSNTKDRIILNTGGIANITYLPHEGTAIGFDTGPANGLMDSWCQHHLGHPYDDQGQWAAGGTAEEPLLSQLLSHPYFAQPAPKSTGRELFNLNWLKQALSDYEKPLNAQDVQATLMALTAHSIVNAIKTLDPKQRSDVYICGGGSHNLALCNMLKEQLGTRHFGSTSALGLDPDWVEATAFAWMAKQTLNRQSGNLPSVTGAESNVILGGVYFS